MMCQQCQKRLANVHFTQIINGKKVEMYLCEQCANEKGQFSLSPQLNLGDFLWGLAGLGGASGFAKLGHPEEARCNVCGMSFEDFRKTGKLGCANCYSVFREKLKPILRRIHGNVEHTGKVPGKAYNCIKAKNEIERLKTELSEAIAKEEYEKAAVLRDRIKELESAGNNCGGV